MPLQIRLSVGKAGSPQQPETDEAESQSRSEISSGQSSAPESEPALQTLPAGQVGETAEDDPDDSTPSRSKTRSSDKSSDQPAEKPKESPPTDFSHQGGLMTRAKKRRRDTSNAKDATRAEPSKISSSTVRKDNQDIYEWYINSQSQRDDCLIPDNTVINHYLRIKELDGKHRGLVLRRPVPPGTLLLQERAQIGRAHV